MVFSHQVGRAAKLQPVLCQTGEIAMKKTIYIKDREFTVQIHDEYGSYWAQILEMPGCRTEGDTIDELMKNIYEVTELYLEVLEEDNKVDSLPSRRKRRKAHA